MLLHFYKYQGTGNDFVIADNRKGQLQLTGAQIRFLCHRRFGIGADGLMLLNSHPEFDFLMTYYNADGGESTMCGNGGRCLVKFAADCGIDRETYRFLAIDGVHEARLRPDGTVALKMNDVDQVKGNNGRFEVNTGSPHYVDLVDNVMAMDVVEKGRAVRYSEMYRAEGINVNFVEKKAGPDQITVRTYERGVEDETYSCGTGVTAAALVCATHDGPHQVQVETKGGNLLVQYEKAGTDYRNIWLIGPAVKVFEGNVDMNG